ncbi:hypothetical protein FKW77_008253 [Venturia effusa]|uniref:DUF7514 domain-containing protein n=1 Tax=Venturia effusa TaxID=50376 RepID=A0A517L3U9_9PEZI|nr:hypothetical protein FKW77_008253 [Venturia effusa]
MAEASPTADAQGASPVDDMPPSPDTPQPQPTSEEREALQYWGFLVKKDKCGTELLNRLLSGIARYIATNFEPNDCSDLTPAQLAAFYRAVGGNYDILFVDTPPSSIAFIYKSLGCLHSIQPTKDNDGYQPPAVPSLKPKGFITWQTIQLLLGPEEHVPFLQNAVRQFDLVDPKTGKAFPKILPKEAFPDKPNKEMLDWYEEVSDKLKKESEAYAREPSGGANVSSNDFSAGESGDERNEAAKYFSNPLYRDRGGRPGIVRRGSRPGKPSPRQMIEDRGRAVMHSVRHLWNPQVHPRRRSLPEKAGEEAYDDDDYEDITPTSLHPRHTNRHPAHHRSRSSRTNSDDDEPVMVEMPTHHSHSRQTSRSPRRGSPGSKHASSHPSPVLRHHRSEEMSPSRDYFPRYHEHERRISSSTRTYLGPESLGGFAPSKAPPFAAQVAQSQAKRPPPRPPSEERGSYNGRPTVRYSRQSIEPIGERPRYNRSKRSADREEYEERSQSYDREGDRHRTRGGRYVEGTGGRRYPVESPWR